MTTEPDPRQALRDRMTARRKALTPQARMAAAQGLRRQLETLPAYLGDSRIAGYWACAGELPLNLALAPLPERGQQLYLPRIGARRSLSFEPWNMGDPVEANRHGIPEPVASDHAVTANELDLVLLPLLAFDSSGQRLGFGGGYYDASLAFLHGRQRPARPLLVGIGYAFQQCPSIEPQPWDVRLDYVATEQQLIDCNQSPPTT